MANQSPLSGLTDAAGGFVLPETQGETLTNGLLREAGAFALAGDARATSTRREKFAVYLGRPTAAFVGEGARKPVTGAEFAELALNVKKIATIIVLTEEMQEDVRSGDLNVLVDQDIRGAIGDVADAHALGFQNGAAIATSFDTSLSATSQTVALGSGQDRLRTALSAAMGKLEANGYRDKSQMGVVLTSDVEQHIRDARTGSDATKELYESDSDPFYGLQRQFSSNLGRISSTGTAPATTVGFVVYRPNLHVRLRKDVTLKRLDQASIVDGATTRHLAQDDLIGLRYVIRPGFQVHDINRSVVAITKAAVV